MSDLSRQVQRLLVEVQAAGAAAAGSSSPSAAFAGGDANDVTTQVLLEFKDIQVGERGPAPAGTWWWTAVIK